MRRLWLIFTQAVTVAVAVLFVVATLKPQWLGTPARSLLPAAVVSVRTAPPILVPDLPGQAASGAPAAPAVNLASAAQIAMPAVVSVTTSVARGHSSRRSGIDLFHGDMPQQEGFGSGVIVSPEGVLLTNHHVIAGAQDIEVRLGDGRTAMAEVVGTDPETDLAVLRIALERLPAITLGHVDALRVGDPVLAIGNPFNVGQTVTSGIVSALGREGLGLSTFESFIQTDAAINPGNSGGALVDGQGRLIGINTAIYTRSDGGSIGIGFAIPVDVARQVMESLLRDGEVRRGWIGVEPRQLTEEFIASFELPVRSGVLIAGVLQDGPAHRGGMKPGDVVVRVADAPVANVSQLLNAVAALAPGDMARLGVQRGAQSLEIEVKVAQRPAVNTANQQPRSRGANPRR